MAMYEINVGEKPNDRNADTVRDAFQKTNQNFSLLSSAEGLRGDLSSTSDPEKGAGASGYTRGLAYSEDSTGDAINAALKYVADSDDVAALLSDTAITYTASKLASVDVGSLVRTRSEGFVYEVMPLGSAQAPTGFHVATAGGVLLKVLPSDDHYDVRAFGAIAGAAAQDGPIDLCLLVAALTGVPARLPSGLWIKTTSLAITVTGDKALRIDGAGDGSTNLRLNTGGDGLTINLTGNYWLWSAGGSTALLINDVVFSTTNLNTGIGVQVIGQSAQGRPGPSVRFSRCMWRGHSSFGQFWAWGLKVLDCQNTWYDFCRWESGGPSNITANGVYIDGTAQANSPTLHYFNGCVWDYGDVALEIGDFVEGVYLSNPTIVGPNIGVRWFPSQGESGLVISGGHFNCKQRWIDIDNLFDFEVYGSLMYRLGADATFRGIKIVDGGRFTITGNVFVGGNSADGADIGIEVNSLINDAKYGGLIDNNSFHSWQNYAVWAGANANYLTIGDGNVYRNCAARILNQSLNNSVYIAPKTWAATINKAFTGGATTENVDVALPLGAFRLTPTADVGVDSPSRAAIAGWYDFANSTATNLRFVFTNPAGGNIDANTYRLHVRASESVISNTI